MNKENDVRFRKILRKDISEIYVNVVGETNIDSIEYLTNLLYKYRGINIDSLSPFTVFYDAFLEEDDVNRRMRRFRNAAEQSTLRGGLYDDSEYAIIGVTSYKALLYDYDYNYNKADKSRKIDYINTRISCFANEFETLSDYFFRKNNKKKEKSTSFLSFNFGDFKISTNDFLCMDKLMEIIEKHFSNHNVDVNKLKDSIEKYKIKHDKEFPDELIKTFLSDKNIREEYYDKILDLRREYADNPTKETERKILSIAPNIYSKGGIKKLKVNLENVRKRRAGKDTKY